MAGTLAERIDVEFPCFVIVAPELVDESQSAPIPWYHTKKRSKFDIIASFKPVKNSIYPRNIIQFLQKVMNIHGSRLSPVSLMLEALPLTSSDNEATSLIENSFETTMDSEPSRSGSPLDKDDVISL